jgi:hypothetical protein
VKSMCFRSRHCVIEWCGLHCNKHWGSSKAEIFSDNVRISVFMPCVLLLESELMFKRSCGRKAPAVRKNVSMLAGCGMGLKLKTLRWSVGSLCVLPLRKCLGQDLVIIYYLRAA